MNDLHRVIRTSTWAGWRLAGGLDTIDCRHVIYVTVSRNDVCFRVRTKAHDLFVFPGHGVVCPFVSTTAPSAFQPI